MKGREERGKEGRREGRWKCILPHFFDHYLLRKLLSVHEDLRMRSSMQKWPPGASSAPLPIYPISSLHLVSPSPPPLLPSSPPPLLTSLPFPVIRAASGLAWNREWLKPRQPYIELAVSLRAFWRMSYCRYCSELPWQPFISCFT